MSVESLKQILQRLAPSGSFQSNVLTLLSGTVLAQALPVLVSPLLTRLYDPADFGIFALYSSISALMAVVATGRYELAVMLPKEHEDAASICVLSVCLAVCVGGLTLAVMAGFGTELAQLFRSNEIWPWLFLVPLSVVMSGFNQTVVYWCNRRGKYHFLAQGGVLQAVTVAAISLMAGYVNGGAAGLIVASVTGMFVYGVFLGYVEFPWNAVRLGMTASGRLRHLALEYRDMPLFSTMEAFVGMAALQLPLFFMTAYYSVSTAGQYSLAYKVVLLPTGMIGSAIGQVFYQRFTSSLMTSEDSSKLLKKTWLTLSAIALVPSLTLFFFAPKLFSLFFGASWQEAGEIASYLSVLMFMSFVFSSTSFSHVALRIQHISLAFAVASLVFKAVIIFFCYKLSASFYSMMFLIVMYETIQIMAMNGIALRKTKLMSLGARVPAS